MATTPLATPAPTPRPIASPALQFPMFPASAGINQGPALVQGLKNVGAFFDTPPNLATAERLPSAMPSAVASPAGAGYPGRGVINPIDVNDVTGGSIVPGAAALPGMTSAAGGGRGTVNPPVVSLTGDARPDLAGIPSLGGATGTAVDGAAGVRKFATADGRTLYSNVAGADNDQLMSLHPGVQIIPSFGGAQPTGGAPAAVTPSSPSVDAALSAARGAAADRGDWQAVSDSYGGKFAGGQYASAPRVPMSQEAARLANARFLAELSAGSSHYATDAGMTNAVTAALAHITGSKIAASASGYSADQGLAGVQAGVTERGTEFAGTPRAIGQHIEMINGLPTTVTTYGMPAGQTALTPINSTPEKPAPAEGATGTLKDGRKFKIVNGQPTVVQ